MFFSRVISFVERLKACSACLFVKWNGHYQKPGNVIDNRLRIVKPGMVVGFCNPLLDMTVVGNKNMLKRYHLKSNDAIWAEEKHLGIFEELAKDPNVKYTAGGSAQNSLRVFQWILGEPNTATCFGAVGDDQNSKILKSEANRDGLDVRYQYHSGEQTGTCAVIVTNGGKDRSLCANLSASRNYTNDHLELPESKKIIQNAEFYLVTGFFLATNSTAVEKIAKTAYQRNRPLLFNTSAQFIFKSHIDSVMSILPYISIVIGNAEEAKAFARAIHWETSDVMSIARKMSTLNVEKVGYRMVIFTQDDRPVIAATNGLVSTFNVPKVPEKDIVDTNGAGDAFMGAFVAKYVLGYPLDSCVRAAIDAGCYTIQRNGVTRGDARYRAAHCPRLFLVTGTTSTRPLDGDVDIK